jgi:hypothetical protein
MNTNDIIVKGKINYTDEGQKLTISITVPYSSHQCIKNTDSCASCPCGYQQDNCGRNVPFEDIDYKKRPDKCELKEIDTRLIIDNKLKELGI